ncbi:hypothetical protein [Dyella terrae]|jgi:hypothetical protein|uniref:hypothetical protein n=1 Tax=Dyella terrae TaxID=522259 RepID=UPI001EFEE132|nr:hypothetical protein [Dyella terrae]ULU24954.1 hypothetical protein DYST_01874 [Dyella terrae]
MEAISAQFFNRDDGWFWLVFGIIALVSGAKGVLKRELRTRSKGGRVTTYSGRDAVIHGWIGVLIGVAALIFGFVNLI